MPPPARWSGLARRCGGRSQTSSASASPTRGRGSRSTGDCLATVALYSPSLAPVARLFYFSEKKVMLFFFKKKPCRERQRIPQSMLTKRKAQEWAEERYRIVVSMGESAYEASKKAQANGASSSEDAPTFNDFGPRYVREWLLVEDYSEGTRAEYQRLLESDVYPAVGTTKLSEPRLDQIQKLKGDYLSEEYSKKTINNVLTLISQILKYAIDSKVLALMPCTITQFDVDDPRCSGTPMRSTRSS
jgi:hypothetical protein